MPKCSDHPYPHYHHCPFVKDAHNDNRYVCLKCGKERNIDRWDGVGTFLMLFLVSVVLAVVFS